ncbi:putative Rhs family protein [Candidatus Termititenax aidoneus]|uniref:Rhs family protein n=1 Tax=Termititenax aidoneus TaxID=2218524 RepID=A0A388T945_TERA1|nr:putative Rhs family protein [Candidatus Termititenax aidoneus]
MPSSDIEFQYTDKELDTNTDLYYFQARYMDPKAGRFPSRDNVRLEDKKQSYFKINPYIYAHNNPVRHTDPDGDDVVSMHGGAGGNEASTIGLADRLQAFYKTDVVVNWSGKHNGIYQSSPESAAKYLSEYRHKDSSIKVVAGHSMGADAIARAYGKEGVEKVDELILIMPRVDEVKNNIQNMSQNAKRVDIYMLSGDSAPVLSAYGNRSHESMIKTMDTEFWLKGKTQSNVYFHEIGIGRELHGGAGNNDAILDAIFSRQPFSLSTSPAPIPAAGGK